MKDFIRDTEYRISIFTIYLMNPFFGITVDYKYRYGFQLALNYIFEGESWRDFDFIPRINWQYCPRDFPEWAGYIWMWGFEWVFFGCCVYKEKF